MELKVTKESFVNGNSFYVVKEQDGSTLVFKTENGIGAIDIFNSLAWELYDELHFEDITSYFKTDNLKEALLVLLGTCMYDDADRTLTSVNKYNLQECLNDDMMYLNGIYIVDYPTDGIFEAYLGSNDNCFKLSIHLDNNLKDLTMGLKSFYNIAGKVRVPVKLSSIVTDLVEAGTSLSRAMNSEIVITKMINSI